MTEGSNPKRWIARRREILRDRLRLLRLLGSAPPGVAAGNAVAALLAGLLPVALILAGGLLTARIQRALANGGTSGSMSAVYRGFALVVGMFLAGEVLVPIQSRLRWLLIKRVDEVARDRVMEASLAGTDMTRLHDPEFLRALRFLRGLVTYSFTPGSGAAGLVGVIRDYLTAFAAAAVLMWFQPLLALFVFAVALAGRVRWRAAVIAIINVWIEGVPSFNEAHYFVELGLGRTAANEVRLFGLREWLRQRIHVAGVRGWTPTWRQRTAGMGRHGALHIALSGVAAVVGLVWAAQRSGRGELSAAGLVVFVPSLFAVLALSRVFDDDSAVEYGGVTLPALHTVERITRDSLSAESGSRVPSTGPPSVELRHVSFRYPGTEVDVLSEVSLRIPAGTSAALVGMNGAGKTTLIRLLCGLYPPGSGEVVVDGVDLRKLDLLAWHRRIAPMFQEFLRLQLTVGENVGVGAVERMDDGRSIREAAAEAGAMGFVGVLAAGLDTPLSVKHAEGSDLSGGQWQRLGIARALFAIRAGAGLLVMDEPTSNLDTASEERLVRRLLEETRGSTTTLLVTHRLALARRTDRIHVLERGRLVEEGSHDELMSLGGRYAAAFGMQASLYPLEEAADG